MAYLNKVFLIGNLTRDPELRYTPSGTAVADLRVAINRRFNTQDGQSREETCFVDITMWARQAEVAAKYLKKGNSVFIEGRLHLDEWENSNGERRTKLRVIAERFQFIGPRTSQNVASNEEGNEEVMIDDDNIPF